MDYLQEPDTLGVVTTGGGLDFEDPHSKNTMAISDKQLDFLPFFVTA